MKKTILKSTFYLILVSIVAKALSFFVRILLARSLSADAMNLYSLTSPTMVFVITLAQMGIPAALSKVIAQKEDVRPPLKSAILLSVVNNLLVSIAFLFLIPFLTHMILKQDAIEPVLYAILPLIPLVSLSGILKGYLFGIQHHLSATATQIFEEGARILFLLMMFHQIQNMNVVQMAQIAMLSISIGEASSSLYMLGHLRKKRSAKLHFHTLFTNLHKSSFDEVLAVSIPMTGSRLIGSLTYFLEPIIMVVGANAIFSSQMICGYGQLNGYVLPILTMPSFITVTLSNFLLPSFTYHYTRGNHKTAAKLFMVIIATCFLVGLGCSFFCFQFSEALMMGFYHSKRGADMLHMLAWPFAFYALQPPLSSMLHALSHSRQSVLDTFVGSLLRLVCVFFLTPILQETALAIGLTAGMMVTTLLHALNVLRAMHQK